jgi:hypothetical protein
VCGPGRSSQLAAGIQIRAEAFQVQCPVTEQLACNQQQQLAVGYGWQQQQQQQQQDSVEGVDPLDEQILELLLLAACEALEQQQQQPAQQPMQLL